MGNLRRAGACDGYHNRIKRHGLGFQDYTALYYSGWLECNSVSHIQEASTAKFIPTGRGSNP